MPNRLADEQSPYLLQHSNNPVDWYPWSAAPFSAAIDRDIPIFLSIGYAACHWCHVMERESFENEEIADYLNEHFVSIKVDREERPDLDQIYMMAVQMMTGRGGWPMSVFLTHDKKPFYGGTYWPPTRKLGMPSFLQVLQAVNEAWIERRVQAHEQADELTARLVTLGQSAESAPDDDNEPLRDLPLHYAIHQLNSTFDRVHGGFGSAPKFPHAMELLFLLRQNDRAPQATSLVTHTLDKMAAGGLYDQLGGGFARYSVDAQWLVPHFEKMLYDNAQLAHVYLEASQRLQRPEYAAIACETIDYVIRDLGDAEGGFHSTEDADSEGEEGKFYVWSREEILKHLGEHGEAFCEIYGVTFGGNFEGQNILHLARPIADWAQRWNCDESTLRHELTDAKHTLFQLRADRVRPFKDDKIVTSWNGLMLDTLSRAAAAWGRDDYRQRACQAGEFLRGAMRRADGHLWHTWRHGKPQVAGFLDDYASVANAFVSLYESTFDETWIESAVELAEIALRDFADPDGGGYFYTPCDHEGLIARTKEFHDSSVPSSNGMLAMVLLRLGALTAESRYELLAEQIVRAAREAMRQAPTATGQLLVTLDWYLAPRGEWLLVTDSNDQATEDLKSHLQRSLLPYSVRATRDVRAINRSGALATPFAGKESTDLPALFHCRAHQCQAPLTGADAIRKELTHNP